jgi:group I intron endonuclease|tara:strand:+ start:88 stop:801 length:714 start_codon:yes stop_codon:yes gene_type:complete
MVGIYKITNPKDELYIGYSKKIESRWVSHKNNQHTANYKLKESLTKYGGDSHQFEVIEEIDISLLSRGQGDALLRKRERYWIKTLDTFNNGLNSNGGGSGCGSHTAESKRKISEALKGKPKPKDFGVNRSKDFYTQEWKDKISESNNGISRNKGRISPNKGKIMSEEQKLKISKSNSKPKPKGFLNGMKKQVIHLDTNTTYKSISEASNHLNLPPAGVSECCSGKRKSTKGHKFTYV